MYSCGSPGCTLNWGILWYCGLNQEGFTVKPTQFTKIHEGVFPPQNSPCMLNLKTSMLPNETEMLFATHPEQRNVRWGFWQSLLSQRCLHCCLSPVSVEFSLTFGTRTAVPFLSATGKESCYLYQLQPTLKRRSGIHSPPESPHQLTQKRGVTPYLSSQTEQERFKVCGLF